MIAIVDYGAGNLRSVANAVSSLGYEARVTGNPDDVVSATGVILPGVGAAADTMRSLEKAGMSEAIRHAICERKPFFAICVGMQVLFDETEEGGRHRCLGIIPGSVRRLPPGFKVPHMGWNQVEQTAGCPLFEGIPDRANFYFVHSYYPHPADASVVAGITEYGVPFCSVAVRHNLVATQFHPEKSGENGLRMYQNFLKLATSPGKRPLRHGAAQ